MLSRNPVFRPLLWPTLATMAALAILIGLGCWQLQRLQWKLALVETISARIEAAPAAMPPESEWAGLDLGELEYRKLRLEGSFLHNREVHYFTKNGEGVPGYGIVTPLQLSSGAIIFVDRGFVPEALKNPATRAQGQIEGQVQLVGVARAPQVKESFTPDDDIAANIWFTRDPASMGKAKGLDRVAPFFVEADAAPNPGGWPLGGQTHVDIRNEHFHYALTWFGLASALLAVYFGYHWKNGRMGKYLLKSKS